MQEFDFYLDRKVTAWMREHHTIKANSLDEAREMMITNFVDNGCSESFTEQEFCYGSEEFMVPDDNGGEPTEQLFDWLTDEVLIENSFISDEEE